MTPTPTLIPSYTASQLIQKYFSIVQPNNADYIYQLVRYHRFELEKDYWEQGHNPDRIMAVTFSPQKYLLLFGSNNGAGLWDIEKYLTQPDLPENRPTTIRNEYTNNVAFSPDGQVIALGNLFDSPRVQMLDINTLENIYPETWLNPVFHFAFSPDGKTMGLLPVLNIWDWQGNNMHPQRQFTMPPEYIPPQYNQFGNSSITFSPDGATVASGGVFSNTKGSSADYKSVIVLWDFNTGKIVGMLGENSRMGFMYSLAYNSTGDLLVSASGRNNSHDTYGGRKLNSEGGKVRLWDLKSGTLLATLDSDEYITYTAIFSPDGSIIAAGNQDGTIKLWDTKTHKLLRTIQAHIVKTTQISFSFDGRFIASSGDDGTVSVWGVCGTFHTYPAENAGWQNFQHSCIPYRQ
jgi:WD40 repeat protein